MINKHDVSARRVLNLPAVRPCESVSFSTLLTSLINLGQTICEYKYRVFFSNKRNARNSIRLVENLVIFLEELRNVDSRFGSSMILGLSELYFILQKVRCLLEDCARDGARLWMLVKSANAANHFRVLLKAVAVALDVLPLADSNDGDEVKELVEFVRKQALKTEFDVEADDGRVSKMVLWILDQFEIGLAPEPRHLQRVLEYLGIQSWIQCNNEVKFLDCEIGFESQTQEKREMGLLSSLMGFLIYCRCTLFDVVDGATSARQSDGGSSGYGQEMIRCLNPDDFRCPITLEIMADPVTIATGHTYDRSSILKWFSAGNPTCPKTGEKLMCTDLVPNLAMKELVKQYCSENGIPFAETSLRRNRDTTKTIAAASVAAEQAMKLLANFLVCKLVAGTGEEQHKAAYEIRSLTKTSIFNRSCLVEAGAIQSLLNLLSSRDASIQENAIASLLNLSKYPKSKTIIVECGGLQLILDVLTEGLKVEARQHAAATLFYLSSVEDYCALIGQMPEAIPGLTRLLREGADRGRKNSLVTIFGLLSCFSNHWRVLAAGVVPLLVNLLKTFDKEDLITDCLAVLATLAEKFDGTMAILCAGALPVIVEVLGASSKKASKEFCVSLLLALCINGGKDVVPLLVKNPSLMGPLYSLLTEGSSRASKKASSLIRILQEFNEKSPSSGLISPAFVGERFIHVW